MAFPTIPTVGAGRILATLNTAGGATKTFPNLSSLTKNAGDLLIAIAVEYDGNSTDAEFSSWGGGFTETADRASTTGMAIGVAHKWSTGSETGTFTVTTADTSTNDSIMILMSIPGAHASTPPEVSTMARGTNAAPDAPALNPAGWDVEDTLWIVVGANGEDATTGSYLGVSTTNPTNYTDLFHAGITADVVGGIDVSVAFRQNAVASEDPPAFGGLDVSNVRWGAVTIAIRPGAVAPSIDAAPGSYVVADGASATRIVAGRAISGDPASYALTGIAAPVVAGRAVNSVPGSYALAGSDAGLLSARSLNAAFGTYALAGSVAGLGRIFEINAVPGAYALTGSIASLLVGRAVDAAPGSYALTGALAGLIPDRLLVVDPGGYSLTGSPSSLLAERSVNAVPGAYALTGVLAGLTASRILNAVPGAYAATGFAAAVVAGRSIAATPGAYLLTGIDATFVVMPAPGAGEYVLVAQPGTYLLSGDDVAALAARFLNVAPASYALIGLTASLAVVRLIAATPGAYVVAGSPSSLLADRLLEAMPEDYLVDGVDARLNRIGAGVTTLPTTRPPVISSVGVSRLARSETGRILSSDDPRLEVP